ncbi:hypothetical protein NDU88_008828 [Pleurodeles waltl]|uniref:CCHC-type domain-containing protein n=1 Tax=Pleurodeles waltl TaxID=8319 RepID=A0AAV7PQA4_PLEWA|nr:hypothetical protein NDU88_008828 [Pleurodeles waltl]
MREKPLNANAAEVNTTSGVEDEYDLTSQVEMLNVRNTKGNDRMKGKANKDSRDNYKTKCYRCGNPTHFSNSPVYLTQNITCKGCGKKGHIIEVCRSPKISNGELQDLHQHTVLCISQDNANEIQGNDVGCIKMPEWQVTINDKEVTVLADSGSPYTLVGDKNWERIFGKLDIQLKKPDINPVGYGRTKIDLTGYTVKRIHFKGRETVGKVYVAKRGNNLLDWRYQ